MVRLCTESNRQTSWHTFMDFVISQGSSHFVAATTITTGTPIGSKATRVGCKQKGTLHKNTHAHQSGKAQTPSFLPKRRGCDCFGMGKPRPGTKPGCCRSASYLFPGSSFVNRDRRAAAKREVRTTFTFSPESRTKICSAPVMVARHNEAL